NFNSNNGPGFFVYLSNQDNSVAGGKELAALASTTGPSSYRADGVAIDDYKYVIILCKPFNVVFGLAELN
ncbi:MAG: DM13 domain-containing protein, partial [Imperialibacter sp.]